MGVSPIKIGAGADWPTGIAVNPNNNLIYTANTNSNNVSVIDGSSSNWITNVNVGQRPQGIAVNPVTNRIYAANSLDNTVSVIDGATNSVVATVNVGSYPWGFAVNPNTNRNLCG